MSDDLVERVAHELTGYIGSTCCHKTGGRSADPRCECRLLARAAIAVVLEEAAKVADGVGQQPPTGNLMHDTGWDGASLVIAAAIRALVKEPT